MILLVRSCCNGANDVTRHIVPTIFAPFVARAPLLDCFHATQRMTEAANKNAPGHAAFATAVGTALSMWLPEDEAKVQATLMARKPAKGGGKMDMASAAMTARNG